MSTESLRATGKMPIILGLQAGHLGGHRVCRALRDAQLKRLLWDPPDAHSHLANF